MRSSSGKHESNNRLQIHIKCAQHTKLTHTHEHSSVDVLRIQTYAVAVVFYLSLSLSFPFCLCVHKCESVQKKEQQTEIIFCMYFISNFSVFNQIYRMKFQSTVFFCIYFVLRSFFFVHFFLTAIDVISMIAKCSVYTTL